jgi:hypothetical protein
MVGTMTNMVSKATSGIALSKLLQCLNTGFEAPLPGDVYFLCHPALKAVGVVAITALAVYGDSSPLASL